MLYNPMLLGDLGCVFLISMWSDVANHRCWQHHVRGLNRTLRSLKEMSVTIDMFRRSLLEFTKIVLYILCYTVSLLLYVDYP